ncbi:MAG: phosphotransferase family protein, partial [Bryobacteraceae bacterium]
MLVGCAKRTFVVKQALSRLRVAVDWCCDPNRIHTEAMGLRWLEQLAPSGTITPLIFEDQEQNVIAMAAVPEPHENWKVLLFNGEVNLNCVEQFANLLARIHRKSSEQARELAAVFQDRSFFEALRLEPYYRYSAKQVPGLNRFFSDLIQDTLDNCVALVHGDYSPKNILVHNDRLILLDHEVIHFGDPAFDVGFSLTHLLSKATHFETWRLEFLHAARVYVKEYLSGVAMLSWRASAERRAVRHTLGCLIARVVGRSPLEYLTEAERRLQRDAVVALTGRPPSCLADLISEFSDKLNANSEKLHRTGNTR